MKIRMKKQAKEHIRLLLLPIFFQLVFKDFQRSFRTVSTVSSGMPLIAKYKMHTILPTFMRLTLEWRWREDWESCRWEKHPTERCQRQAVVGAQSIGPKQRGWLCRPNQRQDPPAVQTSDADAKVPGIKWMRQYIRFISPKRVYIQNSDKLTT